MQSKKIHCEKIFENTTSLEELKQLLATGKYDGNSNHLGLNGLHCSIGVPTAIAKERITVLLKNGADINSAALGDKFKNTPLHSFIANERVEDTVYLIDEAVKLDIKINFNIQDFSGTTALILAAKMRNETVALHILSTSTNTNFNMADNLGMTAAHYACALGLPNLLKALIKKGVDLTIECSKKRKPIEYIEISDDELVAILNSVSIDPSRDEFARQNIISDENFQPIVTLNLSSGRPTHHEDIRSVKANRTTVAKVLEGIILDSSYLNSLLHQNFKGLEASAKLLANPLSQARKQIILKQFDNMSGISVKDAIKREHLGIRGILIAHGVSYDKLIRMYAANNRTEKLSHLLSLPDIAKYIDQAGLPSGKTALHQAAAKGLIDICNQLLKAGAKINCIDADGNTPLLLAGIGRKEDLLILLIQNGADVGIRNAQGKNLFDLLKSSNQIALIDKVLMVLNNRLAKDQANSPTGPEENGMSMPGP